MNIVEELRKKQENIILTINNAFDELIQSVSQLSEPNQINKNNYFESSYPLSNTSIFKGKKIIAVSINGKREIVPTWKEAVKTIFKYVLSEDTYKVRMYEINGKILGKKRIRLSPNNNIMKSPIMLAENLYLETHYDTETLLNLLLQILDSIGYDYSDIKIVIKN